MFSLFFFLILGFQGKVYQLNTVLLFIQSIVGADEGLTAEFLADASFLVFFCHT